MQDDLLTGGPLNCFYLMSKQYFIASCPLCGVVVLSVFSYATRTKAVCVEKAVGFLPAGSQKALLDVPLVVCQPGNSGAAWNTGQTQHCRHETQASHTSAEWKVMCPVSSSVIIAPLLSQMGLDLLNFIPHNTTSSGRCDNTSALLNLTFEKTRVIFQFALVRISAPSV